MNKIALLSVITLPISLLAETDINKEPFAEFSGQGLVKTKADFVSLNLVVRSECEPSPKDAQASTDQVTKDIDDFFATLKNDNDEHYKVLIDGGFSTPFSRWRQYQDRRYETCRNTFQKTTNITLRMGMREDFHEVFAKIQDFVFKKFKQNDLSNIDVEQSAPQMYLKTPISSSEQEKQSRKLTEWPTELFREGPITYVSMGTPHAGITRDRRRFLEQQALDLAVRDAKTNFMAAIRSCEPHRWKILSIRDSGSFGAPEAPRFQAKAALAVSGSGSDAAEISAPVRFDNLEIFKTVTVGFQFEGSLCFESKSR